MNNVQWQIYHFSCIFRTITITKKRPINIFWQNGSTMMWRFFTFTAAWKWQHMRQRQIFWWIGTNHLDFIFNRHRDKHLHFLLISRHVQTGFHIRIIDWTKYRIQWYSVRFWKGVSTKPLLLLVGTYSHIIRLNDWIN